jgi:hypothetical protein
MDIFNQVFTLKTANEIWLKFHELHDGTSNVREQKHCLVLNDYNSFAMMDNELVRDMYSHLNLIINELNSIGINKLGDADIVRKIISLLPQQRYGIIITINSSQHGGLGYNYPDHRDWKNRGRRDVAKNGLWRGANFLKAICFCM